MPDDGDSSSAERIQLIETPGVRANGLSLATWGAAKLLSNILRKLDIPLPAHSHNHELPFEILELGAGTGIVGLTQRQSGSVL